MKIKNLGVIAIATSSVLFLCCGCKGASNNAATNETASYEESLAREQAWMASGASMETAESSETIVEDDGTVLYRADSVPGKVDLSLEAEAISDKEFLGFPETDGSRFTTKAVSGGVSITGVAQDVADVLHIPAEIDGQQVVEIASREDTSGKETAAFTKAKAIVIPDTVTKIGDYAFQGCKRVTYLHIGKSVSAIGKYAFSDMEELVQVSIPESVKTIDVSPFANDINLLQIRVISNDVVFQGRDSLYTSCFGPNFNEKHESISFAPTIVCEKGSTAELAAAHDGLQCQIDGETN